jgi:hypothetical protein
VTLVWPERLVLERAVPGRSHRGRDVIEWRSHRDSGRFAPIHRRQCSAGAFHRTKRWKGCPWFRLGGARVGGSGEAVVRNESSPPLGSPPGCLARSGPSLSTN